MADDTAPAKGPREAGAGLSRTSIVAAVLILGLVGALALLAWAWRHVLLLLFASILIACALDGLGALLRKRLPIGRKVSIAAAGVIILAGLASVGALFGARISAEFTTLTSALPDAWNSFEQRLQQSQLGRTALEQAQTVAQGDNLLGGLARRFGAASLAVASGALDAFLVAIAGIFLALDPQIYRHGVLIMLPKGVRGRGREAFDASGAALKKWLVGTLFSMAAMTLMVSVGLWLLGVPGALALGLTAGLAQFVPFIGPILAAVPAAMLALATGPQTAALVALLYFAASTVEANILYPLIQKRAVQQPPVLTLYSVIAFGLLLGPLGVIVAVPLTVAITIFVVVFYVRGVLGEDVATPGQRQAG